MKPSNDRKLKRKKPKKYRCSSEPKVKKCPKKQIGDTKLYCKPNIKNVGFVDPICPEMLKNNEDDWSSVRDNIRVLLRIRPKNETEVKSKDSRSIVRALDHQIVMFDPKQETVDFFFHGIKQKVYDYKHRPNKNLRFAFDHVFAPLHSNVEIFDTALKSIVNHVVRGFNCSVFAYGATGSGKTYTMLGSKENPGLSFLMAKELSNRIKEIANEFESEIVVSYLEVYNESIKDLLYPSGQLSIREDGLNGVNIPNLTMHKIKDSSDLLRMLSCGNNARTQHPTDHNAESSRSHAVFQILVTLRKRITHLSLNYKMTKAKLVMIDLAGSERGACTINSDCQRCREGGNINKSLLALGNCINALADGKKHIPYRDSKLTRILKDSLGGNCKTVMIANVAPTLVNYDDTYNTLKYADRAKEIRVSTKKNVTVETNYEEYGKVISDLQNEVVQLKSLLLKERETNKTLEEQQKVSKSLEDISSNRSTFIVPPPPHVVHDPLALENFIQLLGQKKKLEESHVEESVTAKRSEWTMMWQKWRIESVSVLGKADNESKQSSIEQLKNQYGNLIKDHDRCLEKVQLAKRLVDFIDKEIDLIERSFLSNLKKDDPILTVTLREFLYYKSLEREVGTHKSIENFHQQMCSSMFSELLRSETILSDNLKFSQSLYKILKKNNIPIKEARYKDIIARVYGAKERDFTKRKYTFPTQSSVQSMLEMIKSPIVEYEPPATALCEDVNLPVLSPVQISIPHGQQRHVSPRSRSLSPYSHSYHANSSQTSESTVSSESDTSSESSKNLTEEHSMVIFDNDTKKLPQEELRQSFPQCQAFNQIGSYGTLATVYSGMEKSHLVLKPFEFQKNQSTYHKRRQKRSDSPPAEYTSNSSTDSETIQPKGSSELKQPMHQSIQDQRAEVPLKRNLGQHNVKSSWSNPKRRPKNEKDNNGPLVLQMRISQNHQAEPNYSGSFEQRNHNGQTSLAESELKTSFKNRKSKSEKPDTLVKSTQVTTRNQHKSKFPTSHHQSRIKETFNMPDDIRQSSLENFDNTKPKLQEKKFKVELNSTQMKQKSSGLHFSSMRRQDCGDSLESIKNSTYRTTKVVDDHYQSKHSIPLPKISQATTSQLQISSTRTKQNLCLPDRGLMSTKLTKSHQSDSYYGSSFEKGKYRLANKAGIIPPNRTRYHLSPSKKITITPMNTPASSELEVAASFRKPNYKCNQELSLRNYKPISPELLSEVENIYQVSNYELSQQSRNKFRPHELPKKFESYKVSDDESTSGRRIQNNYLQKEKYYTFPHLESEKQNIELSKVELYQNPSSVVKDLDNQMMLLPNSPESNYDCLDDDFLFGDAELKSPRNYGLEKEDNFIQVKMDFPLSKPTYQDFDCSTFPTPRRAQYEMTGHGLTLIPQASKYKIPEPETQMIIEVPQLYKYETNVRKTAYKPPNRVHNFNIGWDEQVNSRSMKESFQNHEIKPSQWDSGVKFGLEFGEGDMDFGDMRQLKEDLYENHEKNIIKPPPGYENNISPTYFYTDCTNTVKRIN